MSQFGGGAREEVIYYSCGMLRCVLLGGISRCVQVKQRHHPMGLRLNFSCFFLFVCFSLNGYCFLIFFFFLGAKNF